MNLNIKEEPHDKKKKTWTRLPEPVHLKPVLIIEEWVNIHKYILLIYLYKKYVKYKKEGLRKSKFTFRCIFCL